MTRVDLLTTGRAPCFQLDGGHRTLTSYWYSRHGSRALSTASLLTISLCRRPASLPIETFCLLTPARMYDDTKRRTCAILLLHFVTIAWESS